MPDTQIQLSMSLQILICGHSEFDIGAKGGVVTFPRVSNVAGYSVNRGFVKLHIQICARKCGALHSVTEIPGFRERG